MSFIGKESAYYFKENFYILKKISFFLKTSMSFIGKESAYYFKENFLASKMDLIIKL
ncbi:hypothetical protein HPCPY1662_0001 [Helicobacter pylori CPY1662]|nr:hypothetical protein HPCPY1662_0001 [Helicobacter pylori CPY1662]